MSLFDDDVHFPLFDTNTSNHHLSFYLSLSSDVYSICVAFPDPLADRLYLETKLFLENHVKSQLEDFGTNVMEINDMENSQNQLLHKYFSAWKNYSQGLEYLNFLYL